MVGNSVHYAVQRSKLPFNWLQALAVFAAITVNDYFWAAYISNVAEKNKHTASAYSSTTILMGAVAYISYSQNWLYVIPAVLGAYVGTLSFLTYHEIKNKRRNDSR